MAKGDASICEGFTKSGAPCKRKAWKGTDFCKLHQAPDEAATESRARPTKPPEEFHPSFQEIIDWTRELRADPPDNVGALVTLGRLQLDASRHAIEHQRLLDGIGVGAEYKLVIQPPEPKAIPDDEVPQKANQDEPEGGGKVVH